MTLCYRVICLSLYDIMLQSDMMISIWHYVTEWYVYLFMTLYGRVVWWSLYDIILQSGMMISLSRTSLISQSMTDLYRSSDNLSSSGWVDCLIFSEISNKNSKYFVHRFSIIDFKLNRVVGFYFSHDLPCFKYSIPIINISLYYIMFHITRPIPY